MRYKALLYDCVAMVLTLPRQHKLLLSLNFTGGDGESPYSTSQKLLIHPTGKSNTSRLPSTKFLLLPPKVHCSPIVRKGVPAPPPFLKIFLSPPLFSVIPPFKVFQTVPRTLMQPPPALIQHNRFEEISKG